MTFCSSPQNKHTTHAGNSIDIAAGAMARHSADSAAHGLTHSTTYSTTHGATIDVVGRVAEYVGRPVALHDVRDNRGSVA